MKKMICEICESQSIKKENDVFICQDCGTEYTLEEAKKLLKEISENNIQKSETQTTTNEITYSERNQRKGELLNVLLMWANVIKALSDQKDFEFDLSSLENWNGNIGKCRCAHQLGDNYDHKKLKESYLLNDVYFRNKKYESFFCSLGFMCGSYKHLAYSIYYQKLKIK